MTLAEGVAAPGSAVRGMAAWDMVAVTVRRMAPGEGLDEADGAIWALVLDGDARLETAAGAEGLQAGDAFHVDARSPYRLVALTGAEVAVGALRAVPPLPSPLVVRDFAGSNRGIAELVRICPLDPRDGPPLFAASYGGLIQAAMVGTLDRSAPQDSDPRLTALVSVLDAHPGRPWTVESMARVAHLSRSSLGERFRRELGRSPAQVLREVRMRHARDLLAGTARPVEQIAFAVGYGSAAAFSRAFSAYHGSSPQAWRSRPGAAQCGETGAARQRGDGAEE
ncbi:AraC family transcriptional regulator [Streptomyces sp. NBC_01198]|uniref:AraC family transcriptional regulator n=1 Tax=Streptomyces sp. NBC_01198 TaxID=2903769 RepID=UPI002E0ED419|nr:AraC family transcriptional regulator [Streptomyces sp. NBC_01198]